MKEFTTFTFETYSFNIQTFEARFYYSFDSGDEVFEEVIEFGAPGFSKDRDLLDEPILNNFLFQVHLALGISYYKLFPTKVLNVKSGYLDDEQIEFWKKFYKNGLGEFLIKNNIDPTGLFGFKNAGKTVDLDDLDFRKNYISGSKNFINKKSLLLWGGGKDSIVSNSILDICHNGEGINPDVDLFVFGKKDSIKTHTAEISGKKIFFVKRHLSHNIFSLNKQGYYNGHVPITGIISFVAACVSYVYGYSNIILSNEKSASEHNIAWKGIDVNHQYSKSFEFELDMNEYLDTYVSKGVFLFSLLRGMYEYRIAELFSTQEQFFQSFSSCNRNFKIHRDDRSSIKKLWCGECEKCCFVFLILSVFLSKQEVLSIFGKDLLNDEQLEQTFRELIGVDNFKPFECVGTYDESLLSAKKLLGKYKTYLPIVLKNLEKKIQEKCDEDTEKNLENKLSKISNEDIIPEKFSKFLKG